MTQMALGLGAALPLGASQVGGGGGGPTNSFLLIEAGSNLLLEDGSKIILE